jgi:hypothetical protein
MFLHKEDLRRDIDGVLVDKFGYTIIFVDSFIDATFTDS